jgi:AcrR family transcriptional regulator
MDAVYGLLQEQSVRDLTMEAVAKRAEVGKPTLYKWWPTKAALVLAMFAERIATARPVAAQGDTAEAAIRNAAVALVRELKGLPGKIVAELIAEGQGEPKILRSLYDQQIRARRAPFVADIERGKEDGELHPDADPELLVDTVFGAIFYRLLFRSAPLNERFAEELVRQVFRGVRVRAEPLTPTSKRASGTKPKLRDSMDGQLTLDEIAGRSV